MAHEVPVTQARAEFADLVNRVVYGGERIVVTRHGRAIVAMVSAADLDRLAQLDESDQPEPAAPEPITPESMTIVRLSSSHSLNQQLGSQPRHERGLDIAARHQPPPGPATPAG